MALTTDPVSTYLERTQQADARVVPLTGDASDRRYARVLPRQGQPFVLAVHAEPFVMASLPFANVAELFARMPVPVPRILGHAEDLGILALEDLGDVTLQAHLGVADAAGHRALYRQAVQWIEVMQRRGRDLEDARYIPFGVAFDAPKLIWEFNFFVKHFVAAYRGVTLSPAERDALTEEGARLCEGLASEPRVLCHRDYHSRNLMLRGGDLVLIDFQDARMGPDTYDLVSLLRDAYVDLADDQVDSLIAYYLALRPSDPAAFRERFDVMTVQRTLKALGTFGFQAASRGNPVYIQYIPRTLTLVRNALGDHARFGRLRELLAAHVDELR